MPLAWGSSTSQIWPMDPLLLSQHTRCTSQSGTCATCNADPGAAWTDATVQPEWKLAAQSGHYSWTTLPTLGHTPHTVSVPLDWLEQAPHAYSAAPRETGTVAKSALLRRMGTYGASRVWHPYCTASKDLLLSSMKGLFCYLINIT